jgi:hypothetical protein
MTLENKFKRGDIVVCHGILELCCDTYTCRIMHKTANMLFEYASYNSKYESATIFDLKSGHPIELHIDYLQNVKDVL